MEKYQQLMNSILALMEKQRFQELLLIHQSPKFVNRMVESLHHKASISGKYEKMAQDTMQKNQELINSVAKVNRKTFSLII